MGKRIVVDLDGTLVDEKWPELGDFLPGAVEAMQTFHNLGHTITVDSCRLNPHKMFSRELRDPEELEAEIQRLRDKLDSAGLSFVYIWTKHGKPHADIYIDNKGERFPNSGPNSWRRLTEKVLVRLGDNPYDD